MPYQPNLDRLLSPGARYHEDPYDYVVEPHRLDDVMLPIGAVLACDPLVFATTEPFETTVAPGRYGLVAWVAVLSKDGAEHQLRNAALQLVIRGRHVVHVTAGWGDGVYPTFVGRTTAGDVASFVIDFQVVPEGSPPAADPPPPLSRLQRILQFPGRHQ